ncbi:MAG: carboxypeptidase-like regulatory domain-containing protein [Bacteroidales bacterium]|nr:carboxypeptidase-like regulatory domain-containing protein [Bacteroidales bacterium]
MRHFTLTLFVMLLSVFAVFSQTGSIKGLVIDEKTVEPIEGVIVAIKGTTETVATNAEGRFTLVNIPAGEGILVFTGTNFEVKELAYILEQGAAIEIGTVTMKFSGIAVAQLDALPIIVLEETELEEEGSQGMSGLLFSSGDVFSSTAAFNWGSARFRVRGYDNENDLIYMNGILMNDLVTGRPNWSDWGGLNDAVRNSETLYGLGSNNFSIPSIGGVSNIITRASQYPEGIKTSYANSMGNYKNRLIITYSTGMMNNNWAITASASRRWSEEGYVEGTDYNAYSYFLAIERKINASHSIAFTAFGAPQKRGKLIGSTQEVYDLYGSNYYNANWGYQNGEVRNARVADNHEPMGILTHYWNLDEKTTITTSASYAFGYNGGTALNWYGVADPRPTYYRYLPYYNAEEPLYLGWENKHIDWDQFYFVNGKNLDNVPDAFGIEGNSITGNRSAYIVEDRKVGQHKIVASTVISHELTSNIKLKGGLDYNWLKARNYKEIEDLLGGDFWLDIDQFAERDNQTNDSTYIQSNLLKPNRLVKEGDRFGYDYYANISKFGFWAQGDFVYGNFDFYGGGGLSYTSFYRTGNMQNGRFPNDSYGDSEKQSFLNYQLNGGGTYKITGRHIVTANIAYLTRAPYFEDAYISPRTRDHVVEGLTNEKVFSVDANYIIRSPYIDGRLTGYYTTFKDQADVLSFYHDVERTFVNYAMSGIDKEHMGMELGLSVKPTSEISVNGVVALGQYIYTSRPKVTVGSDNEIELENENDVVYYKNYYVEGTPQTAASLALRYNSPKFWWAEFSGSYYDRNYLSMNPARRTSTAIAGLDPNTEYGSSLINKITSEEKLPADFTLDFSGGKSWKIKKYYISLYARVNNILDNQEIRTGGYEQLRFDYVEKDIDKFAPVYYYMYGRTYYVILTLRF